MKHQKPARMNPVQRAILRQRWSSKSVMGQIHALDDLAQRKQITEVDRGSLMVGMMAAQRIIEVTPIEVVTDAAQLYDEHSKAWGKS